MLFSPTAINSLAVSLYAILFRLLVVVDTCTVHADPSGLVTIVPLSPTAINVLLPYATSTKFSLVPDVCSGVVIAPLLVVKILPPLATIITNVPFDDIAFKNASDMFVVTPLLTMFQINPSPVLCNITACVNPLAV